MLTNFPTKYQKNSFRSVQFLEIDALQDSEVRFFKNPTRKRQQTDRQTLANSYDELLFVESNYPTLIIFYNFPKCSHIFFF